VRKPPFNNDSTPAERRRVVRETGASTYADHVYDDTGGRYRKQTPSTITGAQPVVEYPAQPAGSPWAGEQAVEPALGYDVNAQEPTGTHAEIQASICESDEGMTPTTSSCSLGAACSAAESHRSAASSAPAPPQSKPKSRRKR
jgi:hypothetical protein